MYARPEEAGGLRYPSQGYDWCDNEYKDIVTSVVSRLQVFRIIFMFGEPATLKDDENPY
jgi:hypothetical protein